MWTENDIVASFEKYVDARILDGKVLIKTGLTWIDFYVPEDYFGSDTWWINQIVRISPSCKELIKQIALSNIRGDNFDSFLNKVSCL